MNITHWTSGVLTIDDVLTKNNTIEAGWYVE